MDHAGEHLGLLPACLAVKREYDYCGKQMELGSVYQSNAKRLWSGAEIGDFLGYSVNLTLIWLLRLS